MKHARIVAAWVAALGALPLLLGASGGILAQQEAGPLEEIIVTARLKEESAQDIGQSIRAFGQREMEQAGIIDFGDLARRAAGMDFSTRGPNANEVSMRGLSKLVFGATLDILGTQPLVSQFLDEIPVTAASARQRDFSTFDLDRVEVLKGPSPTYFGEGSVGGTLRYYSADPSLEEGGGGKLNLNLSSTANGDGNFTVNAALEHNLVPGKLGVRMAAFKRKDDGFIDNVLTGTKDYNDYKSAGGRLVLLAQPTEKLRIRAVGHFATDAHAGDWIADAAQADAKFSKRPIDEPWDDKYQLYSLKWDYDWDALTLTSVTGYYERELAWSRYDFVQALNSLPVLFGLNGDVVTDTWTKTESFTQELRLISSFDGPLNFLAGMFLKKDETFSTSRATSPQLLPLNAAFNTLTGNPAPPSDLFFGLSEVGPPATRDKLALFGELTWELTDRLRLIGGARWMSEQLESPVSDPAQDDQPIVAACAIKADLTPAIPPNYPTLDNPCIASTLVTNAVLLGAVGLQGLRFVENELDGEWLPRVALEYDVREDALLYLSASKAIRNGGVNSTFVVSQAPEIPITEVGYGPDEVWAYEAGFKSQLLDGQLVLNLSAYYNDWDDIQTLVTTSAGGLFQNAGKARSYGFEVEAGWQLNERLALSGGLNRTKSEFQGEQIWETPRSRSISEILGRPPNIIRAGNSLPNVPEISLSLAADLVQPTAWEGISFIGHLDFQWIDERYQSSINDEDTKLPSYGLANLRLGLQGSNWSATAFVNNLANEISEQVLLIVGPGGSTRAAYLNRPRTIGLNLILEF